MPRTIAPMRFFARSALMRHDAALYGASICHCDMLPMRFFRHAARDATCLLLTPRHCRFMLLLPFYHFAAFITRHFSLPHTTPRITPRFHFADVDALHYEPSFFFLSPRCQYICRVYFAARLSHCAAMIYLLCHAICAARCQRRARRHMLMSFTRRAHRRLSALP